MSDEDDFIRRHFAPLAGPGALGLRDDAALITPPKGHDLVLTVDAVVAGVHFLPGDPPNDVARKALRVNLSDLAAKGASPLGFLLTLAIPREIDDAYVAAFAQSLGADALEYACPLLGGDTVATPGPLTISITAFGHLPAGTMVPRGGAKQGDLLYVTGTIGDAALGLLVATDDARLRAIAPGHRDLLVDRYRNPQPRVALAPALRQHASAAMDVSDGFAGDLNKMLSLASLAAQVPFARVPLSPAARECLALSDPTLRDVVLSGGDDYEILCAVPPEQSKAFEAAANAARIKVTLLSAASSEHPGQTIFTGENGRALPLDRLSYSHR